MKAIAYTFLGICVVFALTACAIVGAVVAAFAR